MQYYKCIKSVSNNKNNYDTLKMRAQFRIFQLHRILRMSICVYARARLCNCLGKHYH